MLPTDHSILRPLSWIIFYYGVQLSEKASTHRIVFTILRIKSLAMMLFSVVITLYLCISVRPNYSAISEFNLYTVSYHIKTWVVLITFVNIVFKSSQIRSILYDIDKNLDAKAKKRIKIFSLISFFVCLISSVINALLFSIYPLFGGLSVEVSIREFIWGTQGMLWIFASHCLLTVISYGIHLTERSIFGIILRDNYEVIKFQPDFEDLHAKMMEIQRVKEQINKHLGFLPLVWFGQTFMSAVLRLAHVSMSKFKDLHFIDLFYEFILIALYNLFYLLAINHFQSQRPTANQLMTSLGPIGSETNRNVKLMIVQNSIISYSMTEYKAWNIFTIDKTFLFTFLGTITTFSVMFVQLIERK